jgi:phosphoesterase RecJ-like protein
MEQILEQLRKSEQILVASHINPDGDAIGSLIAMGLALDALHKKVVLYNESPIPAVYRFLPALRRVQRSIDQQRLDQLDTAMIIDCGTLPRVGEIADRLDRVPVIVNIDHHITNTGFGHYRLIDTGACASAEIVYRLINALKVPINEAVATALYTAILTDTGSFRFSNTNHTAFRICEEMIGTGVDPYRVAQNVYGRYSMGRIKLLNLALDSIEISHNGKLSLMSLTQEMLDETGTQPEDVDGLINYAKRIQDVRVAVLIQERQNGQGRRNGALPYHVSLRSDGTVDVAAIASRFGGGGHSSAAGFSIEATLLDIKSRILTIAETL